MDKTMADKLMYIPNYSFLRLKLVEETFGHLTRWNNQTKFNKSPQGSYANNYENVTIRLWGLL